jgi:predicted aspartyl protease
VWINDDTYALTVKHNNENERHFYIKVYLQLKSVPEYHGNITFNVLNRWDAWAMVDTGATRSAITTRMVKRMGLTPFDKTEYRHAKGIAESPVYLFDVLFPDDKEFEDIEAVELDDCHDCDFIIGMNILSQGDMAITNVDGKMAFSFISPPIGEYIDFELYIGNN